jgi:hypothetical protein
MPLRESDDAMRAKDLNAKELPMLATSSTDNVDSRLTPSTDNDEANRLKALRDKDEPRLAKDSIDNVEPKR